MMVFNRIVGVVCTGVAVTFSASYACAAPAKPLIVLFTPGIAASTGAKAESEDETVIRARRAVVAVRDCLNDSGYVDAVVYTPDSPLFIRALQETKLKLGNPTKPSDTECYALAKAAGAAYSAFVISGLSNSQTPGAVDIELQSQEIEGRKTWHARRNAAAPLDTSGKTDNAVVSAANTLVEDFLRGPLHDISQAVAPSLPPSRPSSVIRETPTSTVAPPRVDVPTPAPLSASTPAVAPVTPQMPLPSSGGDTDNLAEAERHQGDDQMRADDINGAILSYRQAVNHSSLNATYRLLLATAYLQADRKNDALSEVKRALTVIPAEDQKGRLALTQLLTEIISQTGDATAARITYQEILKSQPNAVWAKVGLAEVLLAEGNTDEAIALYKSARVDDPSDKKVQMGYARLLATQGDYDASLRELTTTPGSDDGEARYNIVLQLFDEGIVKIADRVVQNRAAWEKKQIAKEVYYKATASQTAKVSGLVALLKAVPPMPSADEAIKRRHNKRIFAASLLLQGVASLLTQLETGNTNAGSEATVLLKEFAREFSEISPSTKTLVEP